MMPPATLFVAYTFAPLKTFEEDPVAPSGALKFISRRLLIVNRVVRTLIGHESRDPRTNTLRIT